MNEGCQNIGILLKGKIFMYVSPSAVFLFQILVRNIPTPADGVITCLLITSTKFTAQVLPSGKNGVTIFSCIHNKKGKRQTPVSRHTSVNVQCTSIGHIRYTILTYGIHPLGCYVRKNS
jgi:hypothetical protein